MEQYVITLEAFSEKKVKVLAESEQEAIAKVAGIYHDTDLLDFTDSDVVELSIDVGEEDEDENTCETCECYCEFCGNCSAEEAGNCGEDCRTCHFRCPECGGCMHPEGEKLS